MSKLKLKAYIPSASEYDKAWSKFRAFMGARLSEKAKDQGAWDNNDYKNGYFFLRSSFPGSSDGVYCGNSNGARGWNYSYFTDAGLRVAFNLIYNQECNLVKGCKEEERESLVYENGSHGPAYDGNGARKTVKDKASIITLENGTKCIWLNKEECKNGKAKTMELWTLDLVDCAVPFDENGNHNDWGKATKLQDQCQAWLDKNLSDEEKKMVVPVEMSDEDDYNKAIPCQKKIEENVVQHFVEAWDKYQEDKKRYELTEYTDFTAIKNAFVAYKMGEIDSQALMEIVDKTNPEIEEEK